jgi:hypothetical protein
MKMVPGLGVCVLGNKSMHESPERLTQILKAVGGGDKQAAEQLLPLVYDELRRLAAAKMAREAPGDVRGEIAWWVNPLDNSFIFIRMFTPW